MFSRDFFSRLCHKNPASLSASADRPYCWILLTVPFVLPTYSWPSLDVLEHWSSQCIPSLKKILPDNQISQKKMSLKRSSMTLMFHFRASCKRFEAWPLAGTRRLRSSHEADLETLRGSELDLFFVISWLFVFLVLLMVLFIWYLCVTNSFAYSIPYHIVSYQIISYQFIFIFIIISYHVISYHIISYIYILLYIHVSLHPHIQCAKYVYI